MNLCNPSRVVVSTKNLNQFDLTDVQAQGQSDLVDKLPKNLGTAIGLELRDSTQALTPTNSKKVKAGMTFNVALGKPWPRCLQAD